MEQTEILLDIGKTLQTVDGWGTSLCWFANVIGGWSEKGKSQIADLLFSREKGLGLNIVRYNIWGGDHPSHRHMRTGGEPKSFCPKPGRWDWSQDENQRWMLLAAKERGASHLEAFSNSPPYWMTFSQCSAGGEDGSSNLKPKYYEAFADYLTEVVAHYREQYGVVFQTLDPFNEPNSSSWVKNNRQEGCHFSPTEQQLLLGEVKKKLIQKGLTETRLSAPDENSIDVTLDSLRQYDEETRECIVQINTHSYEGSCRRELRELANSWGKKLWMSEYGNDGKTGHNHDAIEPALELAAQIIKDCKELRPSAWVYWQAVEDEAGTVRENGNWGFLHADLSGATETFYKTKKYYAMGNFSKFIRPGMQMLDVEIPGGIAFISDKEKQVVVVCCNQGNEGRQMNICVPEPYAWSGEGSCYVTSCGKNLEQQSACKDPYIFWAEPRSVTTWVMKWNQ